MIGRYVERMFELPGEGCPVDGVEGVERITAEDMAATPDGTFTVISYDGYDFMTMNVATGIETEEAALLLAASHKEWLRKQPAASEDFDKVDVRKKVTLHLDDPSITLHV